ncbi:MAG: PAS domain S-box protein [Caldilineae bacterium]|nr:MAG: PAS domain S-box protein [Caldilineae bacterium]
MTTTDAGQGHGHGVQAHGHRVGVLFSGRADRLLMAQFVEALGWCPLAPEPAEQDPAAWKDVDIVVCDEACAGRWRAELMALKQDSEAAYLPVLVALAGGRQAGPWLQAGFDDVLRLPVSRAELAARLGVFLRARDQALALARRGETMYRALVEQSLVGVYLFDDSGFLYVNDALAEIFGYRPEEMIGRLHPTDVTHPESYDTVREYTRQRLSGERDAVRYTLRGVRKDGSLIWCEVFGRRINYRDRPAIIGTLLDITQQVEAHEKLHEYAERLALLRDVDAAILRAESPQAIAGAVLERIRGLVPCQRASVVLFEADATDALVLGVHINGETEIGAGRRVPREHLAVKRMRQQPYAMVEDILKVEQPLVIETMLLEEGIRAYLSVSLQVEDDLVGLLNMGRRAPGPFSQQEIDIALEVANELAIAIRQAQLREQVQRHAEELEERVNERTEEMRRLVDLMAGREIRMAELKGVIAKLRAQLKAAGLEPVADDPLKAGLD